MNATRVTAIALLAVLGATACAHAGTATSTPSTDPAAATAPAASTGAATPAATTPEASTAPMPNTTAATVQPATSAPRPADEGDTAAVPADQPAHQPAHQPAKPPGDEPLTEPKEPTTPDPADVPESALDDPEPRPDPEPDPIDELDDSPAGPDPEPPPLPGRIRLDGDADDPIVLVTDLVAAPVAPCGLVGPVPAGAQAVDTSVVDVDDDGADDAITTYFVSSGGGAGWHVRLELTGGPATDLSIDDVGPGAVEYHGAVQVDFDISDPATFVRELLLTVGANASGPNLGVFGIDESGCLFRYDDDEGRELVVPIHGSIGAMSGLMCDNIDGTGFLALLEAEQAVGSSYDATYTQLVRAGEQLVPGIVQQFDIDAQTQAGWLAQYGSVNCGGIDW